MRRIFIILIMRVAILLMLLVCPLSFVDAVMVCGDEYCEYTESVETCPSDCADLVCRSNMDCASDESCDSGTCRSNCPEIEIDLPCTGGSIIVGPEPSFWDRFWILEGMEFTCIDGVYRTIVSAVDCQDECGDGYCHPARNETCLTCPMDCGICTGEEPANLIEPKPWIKDWTPEPDQGEAWGADEQAIHQTLKAGQNDLQASSLRADRSFPLNSIPVIDSEEVTFEWTSGHHGCRYILNVGTCLRDRWCQGDIFSGDTGCYEYFPVGAVPFDFPNNGPHSHVVSHIPLTGDIIYVQLWTLGADGYRHVEKYAYRTVDKQTEPHLFFKPGQRLVSRNQTFRCAGDVSECEFYVLSRDGSIFYGSQIDVLNYSNVSIPLDGSDILVLWKYVYQNEVKLEHVPYETIRCGNGIMAPEEQCDEGELNGQVCLPPAGEQCTYCTEECRLKTLPENGVIIVPGL